MALCLPLIHFICWRYFGSGGVSTQYFYLLSPTDNELPVSRSWGTSSLALYTVTVYPSSNFYGSQPKKTNIYFTWPHCFIRRQQSDSNTCNTKRKAELFLLSTSRLTTLTSGADTKDILFLSWWLFVPKILFQKSYFEIQNKVFVGSMNIKDNHHRPTLSCSRQISQLVSIGKVISHNEQRRTYSPIPSSIATNN